MYTLVLDQSYQPHRVVSWQRAVSLLWGDKVEVIAEYEEELRSTSLTMKMPAVVRLLRSFKSRRKAVKLSRMNLLLRDNGRCVYCKIPLTMKTLTYDHVVPKSYGGKTNWRNIVASCQPCNTRKRNRLPSEADMDIEYPKIPTNLPEIAASITLRGSIPEVWRDWLPHNDDYELTC